MITPIIGLAGMGGVGKTTLANMLIQNNGYVRASFAEPLRHMLYALGVTEEETRDPVLKNKPNDKLEGKTPVEALESLGTAWGRDMIGPNIWVNRGLDGIKRPLTIFDDIRYQNEVDGILTRGGLVYRLFDPAMKPVRPSDHFAARLIRCVDLPVRSNENYARIIYG